MNTEQRSENNFTYIKTQYGGTILAKILKLEKSITPMMIELSIEI